MSTHTLSSFWEEDRSAITWLSSQPSESVIYISFRSITLLTRNEVLEFWYGLVNSVGLVTVALLKLHSPLPHYLPHHLLHNLPITLIDLTFIR